MSDQDTHVSEYGTTRDLAQLTKTSESMWNKRRLTGDTPPFIKIGRSVRYHIPTALRWLDQRIRNSTSDDGK